MVANMFSSLEQKVAHMSHGHFGVSFMHIALSKLEIFNLERTYPVLDNQAVLLWCDANILCNCIQTTLSYKMWVVIQVFGYGKSNKHTLREIKSLFQGQTDTLLAHNPIGEEFGDKGQGRLLGVNEILSATDKKLLGSVYKIAHLHNPQHVSFHFHYELLRYLSYNSFY